MQFLKSSSWGLLLILLFIRCNSGGSTSAVTPPVLHESPTLVVVISVDQMKAEFLDRFSAHWQYGFQRLLTDGAVFEQAFHDHALTETGPGHATLATGSYPFRHGVTGNEYFNPKSGRLEYCVDDPRALVLGVEHENQLFGASPRKLESATIGDWLKEQNPRSKVYSVAFKDRSAVLLGGKEADRAYWFDNLTTRFISTDYYGPNFPRWVRNFSGRKEMKAELAEGWQRKLPEDAYAVSREDRFVQEMGSFLPDFPHTRDRMRPGIRAEFKDYLLLWSSPFGDALTLKFAEELVKREDLGRDDDLDLLLISCSTADAVGHHFGPNSQEVQDYYLWLDEYLGRFFDFLDQQVGKDNYLLVLSSDHGALPMPEDLAAQGKDARRILTPVFDQAMQELEKKVKSRLGLQDSLLLVYDRAGLNLSYVEAQAKGVSPQRLRQAVAEELRQLDFVADVITKDEIEEGVADRPFIAQYRHSYRADRGFELFILPREHYLVNYQTTGTSHGSPYAYDAHVPLIFYGGAFLPGRYSERVNTVDLAPTMARAVGLEPGGTIDGRVLEMVLRRRKMNSAGG